MSQGSWPGVGAEHCWTGSTPFHSRADRITLELRHVLRELVDLAGTPGGTPITAPARETP